LVSHATDPDWTVVISGQDYPARPVTDLHAKLRETNADCFVTVRATIDSHRPKVDEGEATYWHARYYYRWYRLPRLASRVRIKGRWRLRRMWARISLAQPFIYVWFLPANGGTMVGFRRRRTPFGPTFQCYAGSQWFAVNRRALRALMDFTARCPDVVRFYARTVIPDESLILSALMNDGSVTTAGPSLTYDRFARSGDAHPELLTIRDLAAIQRSGAFFARKILDPRLVIALDARLDATR
jgi:hypothetical protein